MKKSLLIALSIVIYGNLVAQNITAYFYHSNFNTSENKPYIETYLSVIGNSVKFSKNLNGKYQGIIEVSIAIKQGEDIKAARKYNLLSPEILSDTLDKPNFIDQQRFSLPAGEYTIEMEIKDKNKENKPFLTNEKANISFADTGVSLSDIQLIESYTKVEKQSVLTKSGYDLVPYVSDFYPENMEKINFYCEAYGTQKALGENEKFIFNYYIEKFETETKLNNYGLFSKQTTGKVNPFLGSFNMKDLPSGNYNLVVEVIDKNNSSRTKKKIFFQRKNIFGKLSMEDIAAMSIEKTFVSYINNKDTLKEYIRCTWPISSDSERKFSDNILGNNDIKFLQQFFYTFWINRNAFEPEYTWNEYYKRVLSVNKAYGTPRFKGYETDRGRVYLQYGSPDDITKNAQDPSSYPYEIWQYYRLANGQTNKKFIFYDRDLASNNYRLLHSDVRGETYNPRWQIILTSRSSKTPNFDTEKASDRFGQNDVEGLFRGTNSGNSTNQNDPK